MPRPSATHYNSAVFRGHETCVRIGMIEQFPPQSTDGEARLVLRPHRALSARQLLACFALLGLCCTAVALLSWWQGNVFAPLFALFDLTLVAVALRWAWRRGERAEVIAVSPEAVAVRRLPEFTDAFCAHPMWVRVSVLHNRGDDHVCLSSRGRQVEVGAFLSPGERTDLARTLTQLLATVLGRRAADASSQDIGTTGR